MSRGVGRVSWRFKLSRLRPAAKSRFALDSTSPLGVSCATTFLDRSAMPPSISDLFDDFRDGNISRRRLLQALAAAAVAVPALAVAQGRTGTRPDSGRAGAAGGR